MRNEKRLNRITEIVAEQGADGTTNLAKRSPAQGDEIPDIYSEAEKH